MLGRREPQRSYFDGDYLFQGKIREDSFYGFLAQHRDALFADDDFAELFCLDNGRPSVPPSIMAAALLLQCYDGVSDFEAWDRAQFDLRWTYALGTTPLEPPFSKATLQNFRAKLIIHGMADLCFRRSLEFASDAGFLKGRKLRVALDTTPIFGAAAVKDTYNLLAEGIRRVIREVVYGHLPTAEEWAADNGFSRYFGSSIKGQGDVDWEDERSRREFLRGIVDDAKDLMYIVSQLPEHLRHPRLLSVAALLGDLLLQDVEYDDYGPRLRQGVARDRIISAHDPDARHGRKSQNQTFDGYKGAIAVDTETGIITATGVVSATTHDGDTALPLVEATEAATGLEVEEAIGDAAYGDATTQEDFDAAGRTLVAKVPRAPRTGQFPKEEFKIDLEAGSCTCPAGVTTRVVTPAGFVKNRRGQTIPIKMFRFDTDVCSQCPLKSQCTKGAGGRTIRLHPREAERQMARALQRSPEFRRYRAGRQRVEHGAARLKQRGIRKSRYRGLIKTNAQLSIAAAVVNLTLMMNALTGVDRVSSDRIAVRLRAFSLRVASAAFQKLEPHVPLRLSSARILSATTPLRNAFAGFGPAF